MVDNLEVRFGLTEFSGVAPIYPLTDTVFLPRTYLPVRINEPKYQELTKDAMAGERVVAVTWLEKNFDPAVQPGPPFHQIGTIAYIEEYEFHGGNKADILLNGLTKVKITELPTQRTYRHGRMQIIVDTIESWEEKGERRQLLRAYQQVADSIEDYFPVAEIEEARVSLEGLVNLMATWLPIPLTEKQKLLEIDNLAIRSKVVRAYLRQEESVLHEQICQRYLSMKNPTCN